MATGPDGNVWFTNLLNGRIGRVTPDGQITTYDVSEAGAGLAGITVGPEGNMWFTGATTNRIGPITLDGTITTYDTDNAEVRAPFGITLGPGGNVWFTSPANDRIGGRGPITA